MKIIFLTPRYSPHLGGVETHVKAIADELSQRSHNVTVMTQAQNAIEPMREKCGNIEVYRIPVEANLDKQKTWQWIKQHVELFNAADIIHAHDVFWWTVPIFMKNRKKIFTTFHGWEGIYPVPIKNKLQRWVYAQLSQKTIHIGKWIEEFYWDKGDLVLYGGVDLKKSKNNSRFIYPEVSKGSNSKLMIVFLGRLSKDNDVEKYIEMLDILKRKNVTYTITWIGDGELREKCEEYGEVTGMIENYDTYIKDADIVFASSYLSMLTAHSYGKIICALYSNDLKKRYLETYPIKESIIKNKSPSVVADDLLKLLTADTQDEQHALQEEIKKYTWEKVTDAYEKLWERNK